VKKSLLLSMLAMWLMTGLATGSCESSKKQSESTPSQSAISATATAAYEGDVDSVIRQLVFDYIGIKDMPIDREIDYTDGSGTEWIRFDVHVPEGVPAGSWSYGIIKKTPGENWELVNVGVGNIQCGLPTNVQTGLGFDLCPDSEEELDNVIKDFLLSGLGRPGGATNVKIARKSYYTDSTGTEWARFSILGIPDLTDPVYGNMKKVPGGTWEGVDFGSALVGCDLPEDVRGALDLYSCPPGSQ